MPNPSRGAIPGTTPAAFRRRLKAAFQEAGITQVELAERCGVSGPAVNGWFGEGALPRGEAMLRLPAALNVTPQWLIAGMEPRLPGGSVDGQEAVRAAVQSVLMELGETISRLGSRFATPIDPVAGAEALLRQRDQAAIPRAESGGTAPDSKTG